MAKVTSTFAAPTTSGWTYYAGALLDCGHAGTCHMKAPIGTCLDCGHQQPWEKISTTCTCCGSQSFSYGRDQFKDPRNPEDRATQVGDEQECETCKDHAEAIQRLQAITEPIAYARYSERFGGKYNLYRRDSSTPTGVSLITSLPATKEIDRLLDQKRICALSPTEGRAR